MAYYNFFSGKNETEEERRKRLKREAEFGGSTPAFTPPNRANFDFDREKPKPVSNPKRDTGKLSPAGWAKNVGKGALKQTIGSYGNAIGAFNEATQGARDVLMPAEIKSAESRVKRERIKLEQMERNSHAYGAARVQGQRNALKAAEDQLKRLSEHKEESERITESLYKGADEMLASGAQNIQAAKEGQSPFMQMITDAAVSTVQSGADAAASLTTGLGMVPFAARAFGGSAQEARRENPESTFGQQMVYGTVEAAKEVLTEKISNVASLFTTAFGKGATDDIVAKAIQKGVNKFAKTDSGKKLLGGLMTFGVGALGEGFEEVVGDIFEGALHPERLYGGEIDPVTIEDVVYDGLVGAMSGALGGVISPSTYHYDPNAPIGKDKPKAKETEKQEAKEQEAVKTAQTASYDAPVKQNGVTVENRATTLYMDSEEVDLKTAQKQAATVQKLINGENITIGELKGLRLDTDLGRANFLELTGVEIPESTVGQYQEQLRIAKTAKDVQAITEEDSVEETEVEEVPLAPGVAPTEDQLRSAVEAQGGQVSEQQAADSVALLRNIQNAQQNQQSTEAPVAEAPVAEESEVVEEVPVAEEAEVVEEVPFADLVSDGKRAPAEKMSDKQISEWDSREDIWVDAEDNAYEMKPESHIRQRDAKSVAARNVKAFQYDHPEVHPHYVAAAEQLIKDASLSIDAPVNRKTVRTPQGKKTTNEILESKPLRKAMDMGLTRNEVIRAAQSIIADKGSENSAAAKRLELVLDDMLTNGYMTVEGEYVEPDAAYVDQINRIPGYKDQQREYLPTTINEKADPKTEPVAGMNEIEPENREAPVMREDAGVNRKASGYRNAPARVRRLLDRLGKRLGIRIDIYDQNDPNRPKTRGQYADGIVSIVWNKDEPLSVLAAHEITHRMKELAPEAFKRYRQYAMDTRTKATGLTPAQLLDLYREQYNGEEEGQLHQKLSDLQLMDEVACDLTSDLLHNVDAFQRLVDADRTTAEKLYDLVLDFVETLKGERALFGEIDRSGEKLYGLSFDEMEEATKKWAEMLQASEATVKKAEGKSSQRASEAPSRKSSDTKVGTVKERDAEYMAAVEAGDVEKARRMIEEAAAAAGFGDAVPEQTLAYKVRTGKPPKRIIKVYKTFTLDKQGRPTALFVSGTSALPQGVWLDAQDTWHFKVWSPKSQKWMWYVPSTQNPNTEGGKTGTPIDVDKIGDEDKKILEEMGFISKGKNGKYPKKVTALAYRPGWHAGDLPFFPQGGAQDKEYASDEAAYKKLLKDIMEKEGVKEGKAKRIRKETYGTFEQWRDPERALAHPYKNVHRYNQVVFECEMAFDTDYTQSEVIKSGENKGLTRLIDRQEMPVDGGYKFSTNPMANATDIGTWFISGSLKIVRALSQEECDAKLAENGRPAQLWENEKMNLADLGYTEGTNDAARKTLAPITYDDNGNVIPLSERFNPEKKDIRYSSDNKVGTVPDVGYHAGDLGKSESLARQSGNRGTGHFGTGTYFVGDQSRLDVSGYRDRPVEKVDFKKYNLFRPKTRDDGFDLHDFLKGVNAYFDKDPDVVWGSNEYEKALDALKDLKDEIWGDDYFYEDEHLGEIPFPASAIQKFLQTADKILGKYGTSDTIREALFGDYAVTEDGELQTWTEDESGRTQFSEPIPRGELFAELSDMDLDRVFRKIMDSASDFRAQERALSYDRWRRLMKDKMPAVLGEPVENLEKIFDDVAKEIQAEGLSKKEAATADSASTRFMKRLGYEGVDVRGMDGLDNTTYGSVIYDLKGPDAARKAEIGTARYSSDKKIGTVSDVDSDGNKLSENQQKFFANSKARDSEGRLTPVYHGTVSDFTVFDRGHANSENDLGKGFYFTTSLEDADANYGNEEGADLTAKIERMADELYDSGEFETYEDAKAEAKEYFVTGDPKVLTMYLDIENPVVMGYGPDTTWFDYEEDYNEETDEYGEPSGSLIDFVEAFNEIVSSGEFDLETVDFGYMFEEAASEGGLSANDVYNWVVNNLDLYDYDDDSYATREVLRQTFEDLGYDGIIDRTVDRKWGTHGKNRYVKPMAGVNEDTTHFIVFNSNQAKLMSNQNPTKNDDIRYSAKKKPGTVSDSEIRKNATPEVKDYIREYDAIYGKGAAEKLIRFANAAFAQAEQDAKENPVTASSVGSIAQADENLLGWVIYNEDPVDIRESGVDPETYEAYEEAKKKYGVNEPAPSTRAREVSVPKSTDGKNKTYGSTPTVAGAEATPTRRLGDIATATMDGKLVYIPYEGMNMIEVNKAKAKIGQYKSLRKAIADWTDRVHSGEMSVELVAEGAVLLNMAGNSDMTGEEYTDLLTDYADLGTQSGRVVVARRIMSSMSPAAQMYAMQKEADRATRQNEKSMSKRKSSKIADTTEVKETVDKVKDEALTTLEEELSGEAKGRAGEKEAAPFDPKFKVAQRLLSNIREFLEAENPNNIDVKGWMPELGKKLAERVDSKPAGKSKSQPLTITIASDLLKFADRYITKGAAKKTRTAYDRLSDLMQNRDKYEQAWSKAVEELKEKYAEDQDKLDALYEFLHSTVSTEVNEQSTVVQRAIMDAILESDLTNRDIVRRGRLGDRAALEKRLFGKLVRGINTDEAGRAMLQRAVTSYVDRVLEESKPIDSSIENDIRKELKNLGTTVSRIIRENPGTKEQAGQAVAEALVKKYGVSQEGAEAASQEILSMYDTIVKDASDRALANMFKERPKRTQKSFEKKFQELANMGAFYNKEINMKAAERLFGEKVVLDDALVEKYLRAGSDQEREAIMDDILQDLASQIKMTKMDYFTALRFTAMLGNFKTMNRNIGGNVSMQLVRILKQRAAANMEAKYAKEAAKRGEDFERTVGKKKDQETLDIAPELFLKYQDIIADGGRYGDNLTNFNSKIRERMRYKIDPKTGKRVSRNKAFAVQNAVTWLMDNKYFGDAAFSGFTFRDALARYIAANGVTWSTAPQGMKDRAIEHAIKEAAEATFRDNNALSDAVLNMRFKNPTNWVTKGINIIGQGIAPFRKTPANVAVRAYEYSPFGFINAAQLSNKRKLGDNTITAADIINAKAKAKTGTEIMALGLALAAAGFLEGAGPEDEEEKRVWEEQGHQKYSFRVGDKSFTADWTAPNSIPLFIGASIWEAVKDENLSVRDLSRILSAISDPLLEMSMLQGIDNALSDAQTYGSEHALVRFVSNSLWSYLTQPFPTVLGQLERSGETYREATYVDKNSWVPDDLQRKLGRLANKIPGVDSYQTMWLDAWGRPQENASNPAFNLLEQMVSPSYVNTITGSEMEDALMDLYKETGESSALIKSAPKSFKVGPEGQRTEKNLTANEYLTYASERGRSSYNIVNELVGSTGYKNLPNDKKLAAVNAAYDFANQIAKANLTGYDYSAPAERQGNDTFRPDNKVLEAARLADQKNIPVSKYAEAVGATHDVVGIYGFDGKTITGSVAKKKMLELYKLTDLTDEERREIAVAIGISPKVTYIPEAALKAEIAALEKAYS